jgi:myosin-5
LGRPEHYTYLNQSRCFTLKDKSDGTDFAVTENAMLVMGFSPESVESVYSALAGILHLGNVQVGERLVCGWVAG